MKWFKSRCDICHKSDRRIVRDITEIVNAGYEWEDTYTEYTCLFCFLKEPFQIMRYRIKRMPKTIYRLWILRDCYGKMPFRVIWDLARP